MRTTESEAQKRPFYFETSLRDALGMLPEGLCDDEIERDGEHSDRLRIGHLFGHGIIQNLPGADWA